MTLTTRPARSHLISLNSFIASISPMTWPTATSPPTLDVRCRPGRRRAVEDPGQRRLDRRLDRSRGASRLVDGSPGRRRRPSAAGGGLPRLTRRLDGHRRSPTACAARARSRPTRPPARSGRERVEEVREPVDQREQAASPSSWRELVWSGCLGRRSMAASASGATARGWPARPSSLNRLKTSAVFWPPNPNELLSAARTRRDACDVRGQVQPGAPRDPGRPG